MFTFMRHAGGATLPAFIGVSANVVNPIAVPSHAAGDFLFLISKAGNFTPAAQVGWTTPTNGVWGPIEPSVTQKFRYEWIVDTGNSISSITLQAGVVGVCVVYRGASAGAVAVALNSGLPSATTIAAPSLASTGPNGSQMFSVFTSVNQDISSITGSVLKRYHQSINYPGMGGGEVVIVESNALVSSAIAASANYAGSTYPTAQTFELLPTS